MKKILTLFCISITENFDKSKVVTFKSHANCVSREDIGEQKTVTGDMQIFIQANSEHLNVFKTGGYYQIAVEEVEAPFKDEGSELERAMSNGMPFNFGGHGGMA